MAHAPPSLAAQERLARGTACAERGDLLQALDCFEQVCAVLPGDAAAHFLLGVTLARLQRFDEAVVRFRQALALAPGNAEYHHQLGCSLEQLHRLDEAAQSYREAVRYGTQVDGSYNNLGNCLQSLGRFDEAHAAYREAIARAPRNPVYYRNYVQAKALEPDDPYLDAMQALLQQIDTLTPGHQAQLHFALGQARADLGEHPVSFEHLLQANALHRRSVHYDEALTLGLLARLPALFGADLLRGLQGAGDPDATPVFIVGMPRSGSSLIEQILASHPDVHGIGEQPDFSKALTHALARTPGERDKLNLDALSGTPSAQLAAQFAALGADYLRRGRARVPEGARGLRITDKYLFNFMHIGLIHLALPHARIIHSRRSPVDTCLSIFARLFNDVPFGYELGELGRYYRAYDATMAHWRSVLPEGVMLEVDYASLVDDLEGQVRRMLAHCGLTWDARCLAFYRTERQVTTASAPQVRKPIYRSSLARWRPEAALLAPLYAGLGPALSGEDGAAAPRGG
jgi:Flp pilus assembly protein TadD